MPSCPACRTILRRLRSHGKYLSQYNHTHRSLRFEELVCQAFAAWLCLPYYDADDDDNTVQHRATWLGSTHSMTRALGGPDGVARAHGFYIVIEATRKTGTAQWSQEFARCVDHAGRVGTDSHAAPCDVYTVLVTESLNADTYNTVRAHNASAEYKVVPMEVGALAAAVETSYLAFTIRHLETRKLLFELLRCVSLADGLRAFKDDCCDAVDNWQRETLRLERAVTVAVKSYEVMVREGKSHVGVSDILERLLKHPTIKSYFGKIDGILKYQTVVESLMQESLGAVVGKLPTGEELFCPVPLTDFRSRCKRRLNAVERAHARK